VGEEVEEGEEIKETQEAAAHPCQCLTGVAEREGGKEKEKEKITQRRRANAEKARKRGTHLSGEFCGPFAELRLL
jgi:hypothetical protein